MEYKIKISQTFLPYLLVLLLIIGVTVYLDQLSGSYSTETEVIAITDPNQSEQVALWQTELDDNLPQVPKGLSGDLFQSALEAHEQGHWEEARHYWYQLVEQHPQATQAWEMLGRSYIRSERYREALQAFQQSLAIDSTYAPALLNIGTAYAGLQQYHQAEAAFRNTAAQFPEGNLPFLNLGMVLNQQQRWNDALNELRKAEALAEEKLKAKTSYYKGVAFLQLQDTVNALRQFKEAQSLRPGYVRPQIQEILLSSNSLKQQKEALLELGKEKAAEAEALVYYHLAGLFRQHNKPERVTEYLSLALRARPEDVELKISLGKHYLELNQLPQAEMLFKQLLNLDSLLPQPYYYLAQLETQKNNQREAIGWYEKAIASAEGSFPEAFLGKGISEEIMNNTQGAIDSYQKALATWPDYPEAYYHMAQAYLESDQLQQAINAFQQSLAVRLTFAKAWSGLGIAYNRSKQADSARLSLQNALKLDPELLNARMALGLLQSQEGNYKAAIAHFTQLLEQHPNYLPALQSLGEAYEKTGQQGAALQTYEKVVALNPKNIEAKETLAYFYAIQKETKKAEKLYEELVEALPYNHRLRFNLALQYERLAKYKAAVVQLQKALELEPDYERASERLEAILDHLNNAPPLAYEN